MHMCAVVAGACRRALTVYTGGVNCCRRQATFEILVKRLSGPPGSRLASPNVLPGSSAGASFVRRNSLRHPGIERSQSERQRSLSFSATLGVDTAASNAVAASVVNDVVAAAKFPRSGWLHHSGSKLFEQTAPKPQRGDGADGSSGSDSSDGGSSEDEEDSEARLESPAATADSASSGGVHALGRAGSSAALASRVRAGGVVPSWSMRKSASIGALSEMSQAPAASATGATLGQHRAGASHSRTADGAAGAAVSALDGDASLESGRRPSELRTQPSGPHGVSTVRPPVAPAPLRRHSIMSPDVRTAPSMSSALSPPLQRSGQRVRTGSVSNTNVFASPTTRLVAEVIITLANVSRAAVFRSSPNLMRSTSGVSMDSHAGRHGGDGDSGSAASDGSRVSQPGTGVRVAEALRSSPTHTPLLSEHPLMRVKRTSSIGLSLDDDDARLSPVAASRRVSASSPVASDARSHTSVSHTSVSHTSAGVPSHLASHSPHTPGGATTPEAAQSSETGASLVAQRSSSSPSVRSDVEGIPTPLAMAEAEAATTEPAAGTRRVRGGDRLKATKGHRHRQRKGRRSRDDDGDAGNGNGTGGGDGGGGHAADDVELDNEDEDDLEVGVRESDVIIDAAEDVSLEAVGDESLLAGYNQSLIQPQLAPVEPIPLDLPLLMPSRLTRDRERRHRTTWKALQELIDAEQAAVPNSCVQEPLLQDAFAAADHRDSCWSADSVGDGGTSATASGSDTPAGDFVATDAMHLELLASSALTSNSLGRNYKPWETASPKHPHRTSPALGGLHGTNPSLLSLPPSTTLTATPLWVDCVATGRSADTPPVAAPGSDGASKTVVGRTLSNAVGGMAAASPLVEKYQRLWSGEQASRSPDVGELSLGGGAGRSLLDLGSVTQASIGR